MTMERIRSLIEKLNMQFAQKVPLSQLLSTVQMLQNEIAGTMREVDVLGASGISVIVPNAKPIPGSMATVNEKEQVKPENADERRIKFLRPRF